jgi:hypothetical protein
MQNAAQHSIEAITIGVGNKATLTGGATAAIAGVADKAGVVNMVNAGGSLDVSGYCAIGGLILATLGFLVSVYFQWRRDRREAVAFKQKKFGIVDRG